MHGKEKRKEKAEGSLISILQDDDDYYKATLVPGTKITERRLEFDDIEGSDTNTCTVGYVGGSTSNAKYEKKAVTPCLDKLLHPDCTYDRHIISLFRDVYMLDRTVLFVK